ncbi:MAG: DNA ligase D, partial [Gemmatimonadales bacterium]
LEGIVAKRADSVYRSARSADWVKIRADRTGDFAVVGFTERKGSSDGVGALHLAEGGSDGLVYAGRAGSGLDEKAFGGLRKRLESARRKDPPCANPQGDLKDTTWVEPELVAEVRYKERTREGLLRQPVFLRFRDDKDVEDCIPETSDGDPPPLPAVETPEMDPERVPLSNLDKIFWPEDGYTKGDLLSWYRDVAEWVLPFLEDRPVVLTRYPDGIHGKNFFQKDAPDYIPEWIRTERMWSEHAQREIDYFVCDDAASLVYLANSATIPLHVWGSRIATLDRPDWCILDLDPKEAPFADVVTIAKALHALCDRCELPNYIKTSGSSGLHVLVPVGRQFTFEQTRSLGELLARAVVRELPEIATITRSTTRRQGKVYVDFLQNGHGRLLVAPYSVRPLPGAPVSAPLKWSEVNGKLDISKFTIRTMPKRLAKMKR